MSKVTKIGNVGKKIGLRNGDLIKYGEDKAKIITSHYDDLPSKGKLVLVTAITPTAAGEGKTTMSIALNDGLWRIKQQALLCLREPSLGPVFGIKGGATGGGKAKLYPSDDINLHFTGDLHALTSSINLIAAIIDNHIFQGNHLKLNPKRITWKRAIDMNDRSLREINIALGEGNGVARKDYFQITVASELMAIMCLSVNEHDFKDRINKIIVGYDYDEKPVTLKALDIDQAIYKLMEKALLPNLVQTLEGNPAILHGGPFANIAHGCNSLIATKFALKMSPIVITEAGFASDLGAEKFLDIKCRVGGLTPNLVVLVATIKALKVHGGANEKELTILNKKALEIGMANLDRHYQNMASFGLPVIVAVNEFNDDHQAEINLLKHLLEERGYPYSFVKSFARGSVGAVDLARKVQTMVNLPSDFKMLYKDEDDIVTKARKIALQIYHAQDVVFTAEARKDLEMIEKLGLNHYPLCMAKTPLSFSDNPTLKNAPQGFTITIREFSISAGAGFIVALTGKVMTMPGLPKVPTAVNMREVK